YYLCNVYFIPDVWIEYETSNLKMNRLCIYPKDIQIITGKSDRYGRYLIKRIKEYFNKQQHQVVTVEEFCQYMGLQLEAVVSQLR
ncbi:MAG TPA: hypothetical protein PKU77_09610, partial [Ferruginibacter sp.]|nr:hypothetical protein [Ferruginibacter sp.]